MIYCSWCGYDGPIVIDCCPRCNYFLEDSVEPEKQLKMNRFTKFIQKFIIGKKGEMS